MRKPPFTYSTELKIALMKKGYSSLIDWCRKKGFSYKLAQAVVTKRIPAKSGKALKIKKTLIEEFGEEVLTKEGTR
ncbi:MAG: hypothetical protein DSY34_04735 [Desulfurobacterium sp.]|nr:MAG: hypothetical protein DSY34_04735 [Desulfurobacterium sp.]